jgi:hypothetical protein
MACDAPTIVEWHWACAVARTRVPRKPGKSLRVRVSVYSSWRSQSWVVLRIKDLERVWFKCSGYFAVWTVKQSATDATRPCDSHTVKIATDDSHGQWLSTNKRACVDNRKIIRFGFG